MKKTFMIIILLSAVTHLVLSEELFRFLEDAPAWRVTNRMPPSTDATVDRIIMQGSIFSGVESTYRSEINGILTICSRILYENTLYRVPANTFTAKDTEEIFDESFLTSNDPQAKIWITAYFLDVMRTRNRDVVIPHEQRQVDAVDYYEEYIQWYDVGDFSKSLVITQGTISIGGLNPDVFLIKRIEHISNGYCVTVTWGPVINEVRSMSVHLPERRRDSVLYLYFIIDGDYLDVYYKESTDVFGKTYCTTYALIDFEIREQIRAVIWEYGIYDPSKLTFWPRRADGSMDYPHPLDRSNDSALNRTVEDIPTLNIDNAAAGLSQADDFIQSGKSSQALPLWALIAIIGGAIVVAGGVTVFIVKRKR